MIDSDLLSVQEINQLIKDALDEHLEFQRVFVKGEISNLTKHQSGHFYFTLKDSSSRIRCVMFNSYVQRLKFDPKEGDEVIVIASVTLYTRGGEYQLNCYEMEAYGLGKYLVELELLKKRLLEEGVFSRQKKPLPLIPKTIGVITSKSGAAIHDIISTISRRFATTIYLFPSLVQGKEAPKSIIKAIDESEKYPLDLLIIGRGGGSFEDLIAYNDEALIRRVYDIKIPTIAAVGHDINSTLLDLVCDYSSITPTAAAEKATEKAYLLKEQLAIIDKNLYQIINSKIKQAQLEVVNALNKEVLRDFKNRYRMIKDDINNRINSRYLEIRKYIETNYMMVTHLKERLKKAIQTILHQNSEKLRFLIEKNESLNPYKLLSKGYGMVYNRNNQIVSSKAELKVGETITIKLKDGTVAALVKEIKE